MKVGFTGTQYGMTTGQYREVTKILLSLKEMVEFHHGDCVGADQEAHNFVWGEMKKARIYIHPPINPKKRAHCTSEDSIILKAQEYLVRNHAIVDAVDLLIAAPRSVGVEELRSGTWATIRYARERMMQYIIVWPDGSRA